MITNPQIKSAKNSNKKQNLSKEEASIKKENPKKKLFMALNNINDEINVKIDSKDKLINNKLNLDCFINRQHSISSNEIKSPEKYINNKNLNNFFISPLIKKEDDINPFIKTEENSDQRNLRRINKLNNKDANTNIKTDPNRFKKYINSSLNSQTSISKNSENNYNNKINQRTIPNISYINKQEKGIDNIKNDLIDINKKITLHNLNKEDKILLKDMEAKNALLVTDISSLNKKNVLNYNISLSNFNIQKILDYYIFLENENHNELKKLNDLKREVSGLKGDYLSKKKDELNKNKSKDDKNIFEEYKNISIDIEKLSPSSRYKNDLKFFENLIIKMNDEIKNI